MELARGFTMTELVVVIAIVGIIAAVALPRMIGRDAFDSRAFYDRAQAAVRYAQKVAIARRTLVYVCVGAQTIRVGMDASCATLLTDATGAAMAFDASNFGGGLSPVGSFSFDGLGQPSAAQTITLTSTVSDDPVRHITVEAVTGYVQHAP